MFRWQIDGTIIFEWKSTSAVGTDIHAAFGKKQNIDTEVSRLETGQSIYKAA